MFQFNKITALLAPKDYLKGTKKHDRDTLIIPHTTNSAAECPEREKSK